MANLKQRLHKKNASGTYDVIYLEADMSNVTGTLAVSHGGTGATSASTARSNLGAAASSHSHSAATTSAAGFMSSSDKTKLNGLSNYTHPSTKQCNYSYTHPTSKQCNAVIPDMTNYYTKDEVDAMTDGPVTPIPAPSSTTPGQTITWDNKSWLVCHYDSSKRYVYLIAKDILDKCYGFAVMSQTPAIQYEKYSMSKGALLQCVPTTVSGITSKVFVPSYDQMNGGFSWFNNNTNRIAYYQGSADYYWTSSPSNSDYVWYVDSNGDLNNRNTSNLYGFRPCVCVAL